MGTPERVGVAGDWHGDAGWAVTAIRQINARLAGGGPRIILHCGDFMAWDAAPYLAAVDAALEENSAWLQWVDGNHEDHNQIASWRPAGPANPVIVPGTRRIIHLPRGWRWRWHDRTWCGIGGAVSVDRVIRRENRDWWPAERITAGQETAISAGGACDVVLAHDRPARAPITLPPPPSWWDNRDLALADAHRHTMQRICDTLAPSWWIHGHYHHDSGGWEPARHAAGGYRITQLGCNGDPGNWRILNTRDMTWDTP